MEQSKTKTQHVKHQILQLPVSIWSFGFKGLEGFNPTPLLPSILFLQMIKKERKIQKDLTNF